MNWRPIDFQGIVDFDRNIVKQLEQFLQEKENDLAIQVLEGVSVSVNDPDIPPPSKIGTEIKLSKAVEGFNKKIRLILKNDPNSDQMRPQAEQIIKKLNRICWDFTEVLEGCVGELFQQVKQVPIDRWHISLSQVVHDIKDILIHYIEDLIWTIRRLEKPLQELGEKYNLKLSDQTWKDWIFSKKKYLDNDLITNLQESEKTLKTQYELFEKQYQEFTNLNVKTEEHIQKMKSYPILALLNLEEQNLYVDVYRLLKMLELQGHSNKEMAVDISKALKHLTSADKIISMLNAYYEELKEALYKSSLDWKALNREEPGYAEALEKLKIKVKDYQQELQELSSTMAHFRNFILTNNPNPYLRSRWGFSETIVGPESPKAKQMVNMIFAAEELGEHYKELDVSLARDPLIQESIEYHARQDIEKLLHEMGQPLIPRAMMQERVRNLLEKLKASDEIGSPHIATIGYVEEVLAKVMRLDWRYHILHEFPLFHQIYTVHQGLVENFDDPAHTFRIERFRLLFDQIEKWLNKKDVYPNIQEIEYDLNDMKVYLQDFLASVQRAVKEKAQDPFLDETRSKLRHQLLEYRYLFGKFFLSIISENSDGMQFRNQFLFVDQYFESVENLLNELKMSWEGNSKERKY